MITERTMAIRKSPSYRLFLFSAVGMLLVALWASRADAQCVGVTISPGDDIQEKLTANPTGTTFCFKSGLYRIISPISPKNNQILMSAAAPGAVLDGSKVVTRFQTSGLNWVATGFLPRTPSPVGPAPCQRAVVDPTDTACQLNESVFFDNQFLIPVLALSQLSPGEVFRDYAHNKIYLRDNPTGHTVEQAV